VKTRLRDSGEARIAIENEGKEPDAAIAVGPTSRFGTLPWIAAGVMTAVASNGREAIEKFRTHQPDITLMDLQVPLMNGSDAILAIRKDFPLESLF
jgi:CheY-like chemotaxis protein